MAGVLGILKALPIMVSSLSLGFRELFKGKKAAAARAAPDRPRHTEHEDDHPRAAATAAGLFLYFLWISNFKLAVIGVLICLLLSFLFTTVAANATAIVGTNPVSGMTLITIILGSVILIGAGLSGTEGMGVALLIGAVVCTALALSGSFVTDLKIGYWLGATPRNQERFKFAGILVSALTVGVADLHPRPGLLLPERGPGRAAGQPHGRGDQVADVAGARDLAALRHRGLRRPDLRAGQGPAARLRPGHVSPPAPHDAAPRRGLHLPPGQDIDQGRGAGRKRRNNRGTLSRPGSSPGAP